MPDFLTPFALEKNDCQRITTGGAILLIAPLECPNDEPVEVTYTPDATVAIGDETILVTHDNSEEQTIREGAIMRFGTTEVVVTTQTVVPTGATPTAIPIEEAEASIAVTDTAILGANILKMLSITNVPINLTSQKEDSTDMEQGIKSSEAITSVATSIQVSAFDSLEDEALYRYIFKEADRGGQVFALALRSNGLITLDAP